MVSCGIHSQLSRGEGFTEVVIVAIGMMDYLAIFVIGRKRFGIPRRFDRKTPRLADACDSCKVIASVFALWDVHFCHVTGLKAFDPFDST